MKPNLKASLLSIFIAGPIGAFFIALCSWILIGLCVAISPDEGLLTLLTGAALMQTVPVIIVSFLIALWPASLIAVKALKKKQNLFLVSLNYCFVVNLIIWSSLFLWLEYISSDSEMISSLYFYGITCLSGLLFSVIFSTPTIGLLMCFIIKKGIQKHIA